MEDEEAEVTLELRTHSGISKEDMLDAMGRYFDRGQGFVFDEDDDRGRLTHALGVITRVDLREGELTASMRLFEGDLSPGQRAARVVRALVEAKDRGAPLPYLSPVGVGREGHIERVTAVVVKPGDPAVPK